jgi:hypothetical protein
LLSITASPSADVIVTGKALADALVLAVVVGWVAALGELHAARPAASPSEATAASSRRRTGAYRCMVLLSFI